ncbi:hypothetical protein CU098_009564 [Rhizopus stolonifer]|uniref:F-box domain-containing protein n=1 Tax=Rhizopus stolonifer TaxID=4846 RepID=A0A367KSN6_RHIST|nr:hypothetical protein CU098_009564 [Rhizopus stolonifer]
MSCLMTTVKEKKGLLLSLPNELVIYIFRNFLDLADLWRLYQTSSQLRYFASTVIQSTWKIETSSIMKVQCRTALIQLELLARTIYSTRHLRLLLLPKKQDDVEEDLMPIQDILKQETTLHNKMIHGIASYKHKYVLIEDIDIRNRIRTAVDVIFHHAVFTVRDNHRAMAAIMIRLLVKLDQAFPSYCREITYTLADNIKAYLEYTGYKLLGLHGHTDTLESLSACFNLMGAAFVHKVLSDSHIDCAVQRACELLVDAQFKRKLLQSLLEDWLTMKRQVGSGELCHYIRMEIEKCDRQIPQL